MNFIRCLANWICCDSNSVSVFVLALPCLDLSAYWWDQDDSVESIVILISSSLLMSMRLKGATSKVDSGEVSMETQHLC
jgi:hypothetical protein